MARKFPKFKRPPERALTDYAAYQAKDLAQKAAGKKWPMVYSWMKRGFTNLHAFTGNVFAAAYYGHEKATANLAEALGVPPEMLADALKPLRYLPVASTFMAEELVRLIAQQPPLPQGGQGEGEGDSQNENGQGQSQDQNQNSNGNDQNQNGDGRGDGQNDGQDGEDQNDQGNGQRKNNNGQNDQNGEGQDGQGAGQGQNKGEGNGQSQNNNGQSNGQAQSMANALRQAANKAKAEARKASGAKKQQAMKARGELGDKGGQGAGDNDAIKAEIARQAALRSIKMRGALYAGRFSSRVARALSNDASRVGMVRVPGDYGYKSPEQATADELVALGTPLGALEYFERGGVWGATTRMTPKTGAAIVFVDISGSMKKQDMVGRAMRYDVARALALAIAEGFAKADNDEWVIVPFTSGFQFADKEVHVTAGHEVVMAGKMWRVGGGTRTWQPLAVAVEIAKTRPFLDVFIITDGEDDISASTLLAAYRARKERGMRLFVLKVGNDHYGMGAYSNHADYLADLGAEICPMTGGYLTKGNAVPHVALVADWYGHITGKAEHDQAVMDSMAEWLVDYSEPADPGLVIELEAAGDSLPDISDALAEYKPKYFGGENKWRRKMSDRMNAYAAKFFE